MNKAASTSADGSPVAVYAALPAEPDLSYLRRYLPRKASVLDLGCGTGRIAEPFARAGHDVVAVDESAPMLAHLVHATPVHSRIETLELGRRFDLVLLLSHLINSQTAPLLLTTAARRLHNDGNLIIQRLVPGRLWQPSRVTVGDVTIGLEDLVIDGSAVCATSTYELCGSVWRQRWRLWERNDAVLSDLLVAARLRVVETDEQWVIAARS